MRTQSTKNAVIVLSRTSQYANKLRKYKVFVDREHKVDIKDGEQVEIEVPEGERMVQVKIDWITSDPCFVHTDASSRVELECGSPLKESQKFNVWQLMKALAGKADYLYVRKK